MITQLLEASLVTIKIFIVTGVLSLLLGLLISVIDFSTKRFRKVLAIYVLLMRGTPLLLQIIVVYFGLPYIGLAFDRETAVYIAFVMNYAAYFSEIFRGGLESIDRGQFEAGQSLQLTKWELYKIVIIPQVIKRVIPALSNEIITLVKDTSLVYVVGIGELLRTGKIISNREATLIPLLYVGLIYLAMIYIVTKGLNNVERRYAYYE